MRKRSLEFIRFTIRRGTLVAAMAAALLLSAAAPAYAQVPPTLECGRVTGYTAPTPTASGSIQLGTSTFILAAGSLPNPPPPIAVGATVCLSGEQNAAGEFLAQTALVGETWCGRVTAFTAATTDARGSLTLTGNRSRTVAVRQGVTLTGVQIGTSQCFNFAFDAAGDRKSSVAPAPCRLQRLRQRPHPPRLPVGNCPARTRHLTRRRSHSR